jgi:hypothetical protein
MNAASRAAGLSTRSRRASIEGTVRTRVAPLVPELDRAPVGCDPLHRVVEGVQEHPAPELSVGDDVEADLDLSPHDPRDRGVGDGAEMDGVGPVLDRRPKLGRPQQAAHDLGAGRPARRWYSPGSAYSSGLGHPGAEITRLVQET